jgi:hypothetical protein
MNERYWWADFGPFRPWRKCPTRPDPAEVLSHFLRLRGIALEGWVPYLMDLLNLQKSHVYNILNGNGGFHSVARCRLLVHALKIYPPLLGLDAQFYPIEAYSYWWQDYGFAFHADEQGYPLLGEIIAQLRRTATPNWTQEMMGEALGHNSSFMQRIEYGTSPQADDSLLRRATLAFLFVSLANKEQALIFRLLGLAPEAYGIPVPEAEACLPVSFCVRLSDRLLDGYQQQVADFFAEYEEGRGYAWMEEARVLAQELAGLVRRSAARAQQVRLLILASRVHRFLACMAMQAGEQGSADIRQAIALAEQLNALASSGSAHDDHAQVTANELLASALFTKVQALHLSGEYILAQECIDQVLALPNIESKPLQVTLFGMAGRLHATTAISPADQRIALFCLEQAYSVCQFCDNQKDDNFFRGDKGLFFLYKAWAMSSPKMEGCRRERILDLLEDAQRHTPATLARRHLVILYLQAEAHLSTGNASEALEIALDALGKSRECHSRLWKHCIEELYQRYLQPLLKDKPLCTSLGIRLQTWDWED